jgi:hypothetical protein
MISVKPKNTKVVNLQRLVVFSDKPGDRTHIVLLFRILALQSCFWMELGKKHLKLVNGTEKKTKDSASSQGCFYGKPPSPAVTGLAHS